MSDCDSASALLQRVEAADGEVGIAVFKNGEIVLVAQSAQATIMLTLTPAQAARLALVLEAAA